MPGEGSLTGARPFREVKLQWLQQLSRDKDLADNARSVALYIVTEWRRWLRRHGLPSIEILGLRTVKSGKPGYALPGYWPPDEASPSALDWIAFFGRRRDHIADEARRQTSLRRAS